MHTVPVRRLNCHGQIITRSRYYYNLWRHIPRATRHWPEITRGGATNTTNQPSVLVPSLDSRPLLLLQYWMLSQPLFKLVSSPLLKVWHCGFNGRRAAGRPSLVVVVGSTAFFARIYMRFYNGWMDGGSDMMMMNWRQRFPIQLKPRLLVLEMPQIPSEDSPASLYLVRIYFLGLPPPCQESWRFNDNITSISWRVTTTTSKKERGIVYYVHTVYYYFSHNDMIMWIVIGYKSQFAPAAAVGVVVGLSEPSPWKLCMCLIHSERRVGST